MRIAIWPGAQQPCAEILEVARHAEATGWTGVYIADHLMPDGDDMESPVLEAGSLVAAPGALIPRVRIGTLVYVRGGGWRGHRRTSTRSVRMRPCRDYEVSARIRAASRSAAYGLG